MIKTATEIMSDRAAYAEIQNARISKALAEVVEPLISTINQAYLNTLPDKRGFMVNTFA